MRSKRHRRLSQLDARILDVVPIQLAINAPSGSRAAACRALAAASTRS
jgi:hypothetical protein